MVRISLVTAATAALFLVPAGGVAVASEDPEAAGVEGVSSAALATGEVAAIAEKVTDTEWLGEQAGVHFRILTAGIPHHGSVRRLLWQDRQPSQVGLFRFCARANRLCVCIEGHLHQPGSRPLVGVGAPGQRGIHRNG